MIRYNNMLKGFINTIVFCLLTPFLFIPASFAQSDWIQLFYDDFEDGIADGWQLDLLMPNSKWDVVNYNGN